MVQCCFTSTETIRLIRTGSPGRPPRLSYSPWTLRILGNCSLVFVQTTRVVLDWRGVGVLSTSTFCFTSKEARWLIRDGDGVRGWGGGGGGGRGGGEGTKEWRLDRGYRPKKTGETVNRRQNNGSVKAVSLRHCPATSALRNCCFNCRAWAESQGQCPLHCCWGTTLSQPSSTLPTHDLFWANLKVQLHLPPLDLLILYYFFKLLFYFIFKSRLEPCKGVPKKQGYNYNTCGTIHWWPLSPGLL